MDNHTKLLLIACSGFETTQLAKDVSRILKEDYNLTDHVETLIPLTRDEVPDGTLKDHRHPLVIDHFHDMETQVDIGRNQLKDVVRGKHVTLVEHLLTPDREIDGKTISVNDHHMTVRGLLNVIGKVDTLERTLLSPYETYVRSHSIEKYEGRGFFQFDSLALTLGDLKDGNLTNLITVDPHSPKASQIAENFGLVYHWANPFRSARAINPYKLGLSGAKAKKVLKRLRPFQELIQQTLNENPNHTYFISVDDGTEKRVENVVERILHHLPPEEAYALLAYLDKDRISYDNATAKFKHFSQINEKNIDKEGTYIIIDDMYASGGTTTKAAKIFKELGAKKVIVLTTHAVTMPNQYEKANDRQYVDEVFCIDTVPQNDELNVKYINATPDLLAAELYKVHQKLVMSR